MYLGTCTPWYELQIEGGCSALSWGRTIKPLLQSGTSRLVAPDSQSVQPHLRREGESVCAKAVLTWTNGGVCSYNSGSLSSEISSFSGSCCVFFFLSSRENSSIACALTIRIPGPVSSQPPALRGPAKSTGGIFQTERTETARQEYQNGRSSGWLGDNSP